MPKRTHVAAFSGGDVPTSAIQKKRKGEGSVSSSGRRTSTSSRAITIMSGLQIQDASIGKGEAAKSGDTVRIWHVSRLYDKNQTIIEERLNGIPVTKTVSSVDGVCGSLTTRIG